MRAFSLTSFPKERFKKGRHLFLRKNADEESKPVTLKAFRQQEEMLILQFEEITTVEEAEAFRNCEVYMDKEEAPLPKDYYRFEDLKGLQAYDDDGNNIGQVIDVTAFSPQLNLKIKGLSGKNFYVPFIDVFVGDIDLTEKTIVIHVVEGMI